MGPVVGDRSSRHRVLKWLQHPDSSTAPRSPAAAEDCVVRVDPPASLAVSKPAVSKPAGDTSPLPVKPPVSTLRPSTGGTAAAPAPATPRQRLGQLWKRWKSKALGMMPERSDSSIKPLSPAVLKRHQQLCELQRNSNVSSIPPVPPLEAFSTLQTPAGAFWSSSAALSPVTASQQAPNGSFTGGLLPPRPPAQPLSPEPMQQAAEQLVAESPQAHMLGDVYDSPFYTSSASKSASPQTPRPSHTAANLGLSGVPAAASHRAYGQGLSHPLVCSISASSSSAVIAAGDSCSPCVTPRGVSALRCSSSFNRTGTSNPSQYGHSDSRDLDTDTPLHADQLQQSQHEAQHGHYTGGNICSTPRAAAAVNAAVHPASPVPACPVTPFMRSQTPAPQRSPLQHRPQMFAGPGHSQLLQLLQAPKQQQSLQQLQPAGISNMISQGLPAGTALTAYPAVAAAFNSAAGPVEPTSAAAAGPPKLSGNPVVPASEPATPTAAAVAELEASTTPQDVQDWLLRAALLEDELQGRALEAGEDIRVVQERRELFASLSASLQHSTAGSAEHADVVQAAAQSLGLDHKSSLYRASSRAGHSLTLRSKMTSELERLDTQLSAAQARAAGLGSALATLQGCQAVLGSSKAARLSPCSKLAILQLVLSDVVARLPDEQLQDTRMLEGLPSLCADGREICELAAARAGSIHASVQPLLLPSPIPQQQQLPAQPAGRSCIAAASTTAGPGLGLTAAPTAADAGIQAPSLTVSGLQRQGSGLSITTTSTATTWSRPALTYPYQHSSWQSGLPPYSAAAVSSQQAQPQQQQEPWYADLKPDAGNDALDDDDDIMDSLSSVLSNRFYTPRLSLSYESRKAAAAAAASRQAAALSRAQASGAVRTVPSGSAAAAGAAALTLAGIASSGSWCQWPPQDIDSGGVSSSQHAGVWDMISVHSPRSTGGNALQHMVRQPLSPSNAASSRRGGASKAGFGTGTLGLLHNLSTWPESPTAPAAAAAAGQESCASAQGSASSSKAKLVANTHEVVSQYLQIVRSAEAAVAPGSGHPQQAAHNPIQQQHWLEQAPPEAAPAPAASAAGVLPASSSGQEFLTAKPAHHLSNDARSTSSSTSSRTSSFDSCITARSRFSLEVVGRTSAAAAAQPASRNWMTSKQQQQQQPSVHCALPPPSPSRGFAAVAASGSQAAAAGGLFQSQAVLQGVPRGIPQTVPQGGLQGVPQTVHTATAAAMPARPAEALGAMAGLLSGALPASVDINSMTVGELLSVLSAAAAQQQQQQQQSAPTRHRG